jgi:glycosyltransferase involved in cell wall biosynthesis
VRIAVYCPHYEDAGGVREVVRRLSCGMVARGHAVTIVPRAPGGQTAPLPDVDPESGARLRRVRVVLAPHRGLGGSAYRRFVGRFPAAAVRLVAAVRAAEPEIVAAHCSKFHAPYVAALRLAVRAPIVVHLHNAAETADGPPSPRLQRLLQRCAARVIAVSPAVADFARSSLPGRAADVVAVPNGSDPTEITDAVPVCYARPYVLGVGALAARKGFDLLLDAVAASGIDHDVVLVGDGPEREALERRAQAHGLADRIRFEGQVDRQTAAGFMRGAAIVAIPSRFEGFSLVCREAMLAGRPIVASALPVFPPELRNGETGLVVPPDDVPALSRALARLAASPAEARALGDAARDAARGFPTWDEVTDRVLAEYARVLR